MILRKTFQAGDTAAKDKTELNMEPTLCIIMF